MLKKVGIIGLKGLPAFGGAAAVGENIIKCLHHKYDFFVYASETHSSSDYPIDQYKQIIFKKFPISSLNSLYYYLVSSFHCFFKGNYDIIHVHHIDGAFIIPILKLRYKVIVTSHGRPQDREKWNKLVKYFFNINERIFLRYSEIITSVSKPLSNYYSHRTKTKINYIPNGININSTKNKSNAKDTSIMFSAGRIIPTKGCHIFLDALIRINYKDKVKIIGNLNHIPSYKHKILELGKKLNVEFLGLIKNKNELLWQILNTSLFVFPSSVEAMSIMLLEVASQKTSIICSDIPENKAIFDDNEVLYFKTNNVDDLAQKITWALSNMDVMKQKAENAYIKLESKYLWQDIAQEYDKLYQQLLIN